LFQRKVLLSKGEQTQLPEVVIFWNNIDREPNEQDKL
jgi:hypothetical protein